MANFTYDTLQDDNVRFLQGTQTQLNKYFLEYTPEQGEADIRGTAIEGAFYLTTDTHRLYVGRKITTAGTNQNKVVPVQVSAGIATVVDTGSLPAASVDAQIGDFYYIQNDNILAVLEENNGHREWVQINAATAVTGFTQTTAQATVVVDSQTQTVDDTVLVNSNVATQAGQQSASFGLVEGSNITLTPSTKIVGNNATVNTVEISAKDTTYALGTNASAAGTNNGLTTTANNGAVVKLTDNDANTNDSTVTLIGENDIGVVSNAAGAIAIKGPDFSGNDKGVKATTIAGGGFRFQLQYDSGDATIGSQTISHTTNSVLDPTITIGATSGYSEPASAVSFAQATPVHFLSGNATLDVYTKEQSDQAITDAINLKLAAANAMTYMGTIKSSSDTDVSATAVINTIATNSTGHNGDTYKAACDFTYNGQDVKTGDLVILRGTEVNGVIPTANLSIDIVPSGDEPFVAASFSGDASGTYDATTPSNTTQTVLNLVDSKNSNSLIAGAILPNTEKIQITSSVANNKVATININHRATSRSDSSSENFVDVQAQNQIEPTDDIITEGHDAISLFMLMDHDAIVTDSTGHVTAVNGRQITFKHNRLKTFGVGYTSVSLASGSPLLSRGTANITLTDDIGSLSKSIGLESKTLVIASNGASAEADKGLSIDIKWGSF